MRPSILLLLALVIPAATVAAIAPSPTAADAAARIAPFIEAQTVAVVRVDPGRLDLDETAAIAAETLGIPIETVAEPLVPLRAFRDAWRDAGGGSAWWVLCLDDLGIDRGIGAFVLAEIDPDGDPETIGNLLRTGAAGAESPPRDPWQEFFSVATARVVEPGLLFCGAESTLDRLRQASPDTRPGLADALASVKEFPVQFVALPSATHRHVFAEMFPRLPEEAGGGPVTNITEAVHTAAAGAGIGFGPAAGLRVVFRAADPAAAARFAPLLHEGIAAGAAALAEKIAGPGAPGFDARALAGDLRFIAEGDRLVLELDDARIRALLHGIFAPAVLQDAGATP